MIRIAVIGAGAAGLAVLRHASIIQNCMLQCFEPEMQSGGTWIYSDNIGTDKHGRPVMSSMYKNLRTNLPKEVMAFPDFAFPDGPSFVPHQVVLQYLQDYEKHHNLTQYIQFGTEVQKVSPTTTAGAPWEVISQRVDKSSDPVSQLFDYVFVCNGHYTVPLIPDLPGREHFQGVVMHSHDYRDPEKYRGKRIVCLGARSSGQDITLELSKTAKEIILSHDSPRIVSTLPENVREAVGIKCLTHDGIQFKDGTTTECDVLLLCTGYRYDFRFLSNDCALNVEDEYVQPLYKHLVHAKFPSLFVMGVCKIIVPFPQFHCQALFCLAVITGKIELPSKQEMLGYIKENLQHSLEKGMLVRHAHNMASMQWAYNNDLADSARFDRLPDYYEKLYDTVHANRKHNLCGYKNCSYKFDTLSGEYILEEMDNSTDK